MINMLEVLIMIVLIVMFILLAVFCILYFKSKTKSEPNKVTEQDGNTKNTKTTKTYKTESVFDFMEFDKIEDNMICIKNDSKYVMVVECQGVNYDLMSEVEKNAVEEGFIQFLNTLRHPIQIYTQTRTINLDKSIQTYRDKVSEIEQNLEKEKRKYEQMVSSGRYTDEQLNAAFYELTKANNLYEYGKDIIYNTERMSLNKNVLNQKYYVVIPYYPDELGDNNFDKKEIRNLAFSELYTRAQSIIRTLSVCGVNGKVLNSNELVDLLYVAYNRDDAEIYGVDRAMQSGYDELYSTAPDVVDKKIRALDEKIQKEAFEKANQKVIEAKSDKQQELERKQAARENLVDQMAKMIIEQNRNIIGNDIATSAIEKVEEEQKRKGRPKKTLEEGGTKENEQKKQTTRKRVKKSA